ncbi:MAG: rRNA maturation RNase YbeY [Myxococcales bacterium]|nr:rRNA maturation RNase YbeY [Myxococcales bacterium]
MPVYVDNRHPHLRVNKRALAQHVRDCLRLLDRSPAIVDVSLVDDAQIQELNNQWRQVDAVTDVLSFALTEAQGPETANELLGDIVVSLDTAKRQAAAMATQFGLSEYGLTQETLFLVTHGLLHLVGHDHQTAKQAAHMQALERTLMGPAFSHNLHALDRTDHGL